MRNSGNSIYMIMLTRSSEMIFNASRYTGDVFTTRLNFTKCHKYAYIILPFIYSKVNTQENAASPFILRIRKCYT